MKPRLRSVYFSKFMSIPSAYPGRPCGTVRNTVIGLVYKRFMVEPMRRSTANYMGTGPAAGKPPRTWKTANSIPHLRRERPETKQRPKPCGNRIVRTGAPQSEAVPEHPGVLQLPRVERAAAPPPANMVETRRGIASENHRHRIDRDHRCRGRKGVTRKKA